MRSTCLLEDNDDVWRYLKVRLFPVGALGGGIQLVRTTHNSTPIETPTYNVLQVSYQFVAHAPLVVDLFLALNYRPDLLFGRRI